MKKEVIPIVYAGIVREYLKDKYFEMRVPVWNVANLNEVYDGDTPVMINSQFQFYTLQSLKDTLDQHDLDALSKRAKVFFAAPCNLLSTN